MKNDKDYRLLLARSEVEKQLISKGHSPKEATFLATALDDPEAVSAVTSWVLGAETKLDMEAILEQVHRSVQGQIIADYHSGKAKIATADAEIERINSLRPAQRMAEARRMGINK